MSGSARSSERTPAHGVRFELLRGAVDPATGEIVYRGHAHLPDASVAAEARVTPASAVAKLERGALAEEELVELEKALSALVRAATKGALSEGREPPRRITRWRVAG